MKKIHKVKKNMIQTESVEKLNGMFSDKYIKSQQSFMNS